MLRTIVHKTHLCSADSVTAQFQNSINISTKTVGQELHDVSFFAQATPEGVHIVYQCLTGSKGKHKRSPLKHLREG